MHCQLWLLVLIKLKNVSSQRFSDFRTQGSTLEQVDPRIFHPQMIDPGTLECLRPYNQHLQHTNTALHKNTVNMCSEIVIEYWPCTCSLPTNVGACSLNSFFKSAQQNLPWLFWWADIWLLPMQVGACSPVVLKLEKKIDWLPAHCF